LQIPGLDIEQEIKKRMPPLTDRDWQEIQKRIAVAKKWLDDYADEEEKLVIYWDQIPEGASQLSDEQKTYLKQLITHLEQVENWEGEELQTLIFSTTKELSIKPNVAFPAIYQSFLGKERGPKAGGLLSYLDRQFVVERLKGVIALG
jgi:lysyl-tRNA synthetase class 1